MSETGAKRGLSTTGWLLIAMLGICVLAAAIYFLTGRDSGRTGAPELDPQTADSGRPLTAEQLSVSFDAADLTWEIFPEREAIAGDATLSFTVRQPIDRLQLDLDNRYAIETVELDGALLDADAYAKEIGQLVITLPRTYDMNEPLSLRVVYEGQPHVAIRPPWEGGFMWEETDDGAPFVSTAVQLDGCDLFWPCFDNSLSEIGEVTTHMIVPEGLVAPGHGVKIGQETLEDGREKYSWRIKNPNNYAISINVAPYVELTGEYESQYGNTIPLYFWHLPGYESQAAELFAEWPDVLDFFETQIGPFPFSDEKLGVVETPHLGMEHQTLNAYGNDYRKGPEGYDWLFQHELAHEWFGNQLTNTDWNHMWLHEGFGAYMQPLYTRWKNGEMAYNAAMFEQRQGIQNRAPIVSDKEMTIDSVYLQEGGPGGDIYAKGSWVLHTLRLLIGDEAFFDATRRLVYGRPDPMPGNFEPRFADTAEFERLASEEAGQDLGWFFDVYLRQAALPRLEMQRSDDEVRFTWVAPADLPFPMPLDVRVGNETVRLPMSDGTGRIALPNARTKVVADPMGKILQQSDNIDRYQAWMAEQATVRGNAQ
ncbi:M1 family metallopeptidase [Sphingomicrobium sediminis]|uniref:Aminopeptidase N n=1 Tax=Sphingomicrobium sediminis TaxID=2950949 RepID=A0A9X2J1V7_9SPHN|nr:M1 family metallopeptidase [Sphingomicrobium sediminis]MCM8556390.1 M1 family metallopeptidase [Sphingomicrobium sediminis]